MKFWVKVVGDNDFQEQLLVNAENLEELRSQLELLLGVAVDEMSVHDFVSQVGDKLTSGADIITIRIKQRPKTVAMSFSATSDKSSRSGSVSGNVAFSPATKPPTMTLEVLEDSTVESTSMAIPSGTKRSPSVPGGDQTPKSSRRPSFDALPVEKICLLRSELEMLIHPSIRQTMDDCIEGCFVRIKEVTQTSSSGYQLAQVASVNAMHDQILVDLVHYMELRHIDTVSNSHPPLEEVRAWVKKMIAASRPLVTEGFIEAKHGEVESCLSKAKNILSSTTNQGDPGRSGGDSDGSSNTTTPVPAGRLMMRRATIAALLLPDHACLSLPKPPLGKSLLRSNDQVTCGSICQSTDQQHHLLFYSRRSNSKSKHPRVSDYAGAAMCFHDSFGGVMYDRDVTVKGYEVHGTPQLWHGNFVCLGTEIGSTSKENTFHLISGRDVTSLYNPPIVVLVPIPVFAMPGATAMSPQLVADKERMHLFFVVDCDSNHSPTSTVARELMYKKDHKDSRKKINNNDKSFIGLVHAISSDPALHNWSLISVECPIFASPSAPLYHASCAPRAFNQPELVLTLVWCDGGAGALPIKKYINTDEHFSEGAWAPVRCVSAVAEGEWRASGLRSISYFTFHQLPYVACVGEDHKHRSSLVFFPVVDA